MKPFPALLLSVILAFTGTPTPAAGLKAVASFSILGDMVSRVGGERVAVTTIVGPNADTHVYEPRPADAVALGTADVFFVSGLGFEGWFGRLVQSTGFSGPVVVASDGIASRTMNEDGETITDPHAWQSLRNGLIYVANIADGLCAADADGCPSYRVNAEAYSNEISALDAEVRAAIGGVPEARRKVITTHDAFGYFAAEYGVAFVAPEGVSTESEPAARDVAALIDQIRAEKVTALFIENMSDPRLIRQIAAETGIEMGGELFSDALSVKDGPAPTYLDMFRHNVSLLVPAMKGNAVAEP